MEKFKYYTMQHFKKIPNYLRLFMKNFFSAGRKVWDYFSLTRFITILVPTLIIIFYGFLFFYPKFLSSPNLWEFIWIKFLFFMAIVSLNKELKRFISSKYCWGVYIWFRNIILKYLKIKRKPGRKHIIILLKIKNIPEIILDDHYKDIKAKGRKIEKEILLIQKKLRINENDRDLTDLYLKKCLEYSNLSRTADEYKEKIKKDKKL
jgi:hypothetical protein